MRYSLNNLRMPGTKSRLTPRALQLAFNQFGQKFTLTRTKRAI
jgi:hypothetical protein